MGSRGQRNQEVALVAVARVLAEYRDMAIDNLPAVLDGGVEDLHQFRVSMRRARSVLGVAEGVLPDHERLGASRALRSMARLSSPVRDLDVYIADLPGLCDGVGDPADPAAAATLVELAVAMREQPSVSFEWALRGPDGKSMFDSWSMVSSPTPMGAGEPGPLATLPALELVDGWTRKAFKQTRRKGRRALESDDLEHWHDLRKALKKLRYLVAAFASQHDPGDLRRVRRHLRRLQDHIGLLQDLRVQQELTSELLGRARRAGLVRGAELASTLDSVLAERLLGAQGRCTGAWEDFDTPATRKAVRRLTSG